MKRVLSVLSSSGVFGILSVFLVTPLLPFSSGSSFEVHAFSGGYVPSIEHSGQVSRQTPKWVVCISPTTRTIGQLSYEKFFARLFGTRQECPSEFSFTLYRTDRSTSTNSLGIGILKQNSIRRMWWMIALPTFQHTSVSSKTGFSTVIVRWSFESSGDSL